MNSPKQREKRRARWESSDSFLSLFDSYLFESSEPFLSAAHFWFPHSSPTQLLLFNLNENKNKCSNSCSPVSGRRMSFGIHSSTISFRLVPAIRLVARDDDRRNVCSRSVLNVHTSAAQTCKDTEARFGDFNRFVSIVCSIVFSSFFFLSFR